MKRPLLGFLALAVLGLWCLAPGSASAFQVTATNFEGFWAVDPGGDVVNTFGLGATPLGATGMDYHLAGGVEFDFSYDPAYPSLPDVISNPDTDWLWTVGISNIDIPWYGTHPDVSFSHPASYNDLLSGAGFVQGKLDDWNIDGCYFLDYDLQTGHGSLLFGASVPDNLIPDCWTEPAYGQFDSDLAISVRADEIGEPVPEPATMLLFGMGLAGYGVIRRRKNRM